MKLKSLDTFIIDLDNTLMSWPHLMPGAMQVVARLKALNKKVIFITDNTLKSRKGLALHLRKLGIDCKEDDVINPGYVAGVLLKGKKVSVLAFGRGLKEDLKKAKIKLKDKPPVDYVIVGDDLEFNYRKMTLGINAVQQGAKFFTCALGRLRIEKYRTIAGTGSIASPIAYATNREFELLGKPSKYVVNVTKKLIKNPKKTVVIGDKIETDIKFAKKLNCYSVFVGKPYKTKEKIKPDLRIRLIKELLKYLG